MAGRVADERPKLLITRPSPDAAAFAAKATAAGFAAVTAPLLEIVFDTPPADLEAAGALAFTSVNGVRAAGPPPPGWRGPVFAVGPATAHSARVAGWPHVETAAGDVSSLAQAIAASRATFDGPVLHVGGRDGAGDLVALLAQQGVLARKIVAYAAVARARLPDEATAFLAAAGPRDWATFFSPRTVEVFVRLAAATALLDRLAQVGVAGLSEAVAAAASRRAAWRALVVAERPTEDALLERLVGVASAPA